MKIPQETRIIEVRSIDLKEKDLILITKEKDFLWITKNESCIWKLGSTYYALADVVAYMYKE